MYSRFVRRGGLAALILLLGSCASAPPQRTAPVAPRAKATAAALPVPAASTSAPAPAPASSAAPAVPSVPPATSATTLASYINAFVAQPRFASALWGISVVDASNGRVVYAHNAGKLVVPASNVKLYTAALALVTMGGDTRFTTTLYATRKPRANGLLAGDLILYGRGDPSLGDARIAPASVDWADQFAAALGSRGVTRVAGDLIADDTYYHGSGIGGGWEARDLQQWYAPRISALTVDNNAIAVEVQRAGAVACTVTVDPLAAARIVNLTGEAAADQPLRVFRRPGSHTIYVSGTLAPGAHTRRFVLAAPDPARIAAQQLWTALRKNGINVSGQIRVVHWPRRDVAMQTSHRQVIAQVRSPPLRDLIHHLLKDSDNLYAQHLLLQVGVHSASTGVCADRTRPPQTTAGWGLCAMRALTRRIGIDNATTFVEGAGLSRKDLATPTATTTLLRWITQQSFASSIVDALPLAGVDGTLVHRLRNTLAQDNLRAKTGTLTHAYALSGFVADAAGTPLVFSLTLNHYLRPRDWLGHTVQPSPTADLDAVASLLADAVIGGQPHPAGNLAGATGSGQLGGAPRAK